MKFKISYIKYRITSGKISNSGTSSSLTITATSGSVAMDIVTRKFPGYYVVINSVQSV